MNKITTIGLLAFLILSGVALAQQSGQEKKSPSMQGMMGETMKGRGNGESGMGGMGGMGGMMGMMKMMNQCSAMMGAGQAETQKSK